MKIVISGSHGLIGSALVPALRARAHHVTRLVRSRRHVEGTASWHPDSGVLDPQVLAGNDAVIHLGGETIVGRWSDEKKTAIRSSRIDSTNLLVKTLAALPENERPKSFICASAIGIYGDCGEEILTETSAPGGGFLADVTRDWEAAADAASASNVRVVKARIGVVLSARGGALKPMLPIFRLGLGGPIGGGAQWWSWIEIDDVVGALIHVTENDNLRGAVNLVAPNPVRQRDFAGKLAHVLGKPAYVPVPKFGLQLALGEASGMALSSHRVLPQVLAASGYHFRFADLEEAFAGIGVIYKLYASTCRNEPI